MPAKRKHVKSRKAKSKKVSESELQQMKEEFDSIDQDHSGELNPKELITFMNKNNLQSDFANIAIKIFDKDGNGQISFDEFVEFIKALSKLDEDPNLLHRMLFTSLDKDGSGELDAHEIRSFYNYFSPEPISKEDVDNIIENLDQDGDGKLSFDELMSAFQQENQ